MSQKISFLVNFVKKHRVAISVGLTATAFILLIMRNQSELNKFLDEHNLTDQYYAIKE